MIFRGSYVGDNSPKVIHNYENISDIPDVIVHYDASGLVTNTDNSFGTVDSGGNVSVWKNQVSTNHAIQVLSAKQPTLVNDGVNSVNFNGTQYMTFTNSFGINTGCIIFIMKPTTTITTSSPTLALLSSGKGGPSYHILTQANGTYGGCVNGTLLLYTFPSPVWNTNYYNGSYITDNISNNTINKLVIDCDLSADFYLNDTGNTMHHFKPANSGQWGYNRILPRSSYGTYGTLKNIQKLCAWYDNSDCFNGKLYEVIIMSRSIKTYELEFINYKINQKWGI